jgi:hypothetical protein
MEDWSDDGRFIVYQTAGAGSSNGIWALPLSGDREPILLVESPADLDEPQISPDGRWLAFNSEESGQFEVYVQPFQAKGEKLRISTGGGGQPRWRGDGRELFYLALDGTMMAVEMREGDTLRHAIPEPLFPTGITVDPTIDQYAVTSDGQRFLIQSPAQDGAPSSIVVVINWIEELKRLASSN